jgi:hypothetical protein
MGIQSPIADDIQKLAPEAVAKQNTLNIMQLVLTHRAFWVAVLRVSFPHSLHRKIPSKQILLPSYEFSILSSDKSLRV